MFNFNLQKRAFNELNAEQFRVVYFLNSTLSMVNKQKNTPDNNSIEMFNGYMMDKLGLSERQVQRLIKSLEHTGFISVERATAKKQPNTITIIDAENDATTCDKNGDKNVTLNNLDINKNNNNITKDLSTSTRTSTEVTLLQENKKYKIKNISSEVTPSTGTFQDEVESVFLNSSDDEWLSYEVKRSMTDDVNNNLKLIDMKKENEMSNKVAIAMNVNEQGSNYIAECGTTTNEMTTSTSGDKNITSRDDNKEHNVQSDNVTSNCSIFTENCPKPYLTPQFPPTPLSFPCAWDEDAIFGTGEPQTSSMDNLSIQCEKTQPEPQECPQNEFNRERMLELFKISAKETVLERFKEQLKEMDAYMQYLKKNDHFTYKIYLKEILSWWNNPMNVWNSDFDFICVGNGFKRKYVA